MNFVQRHRKLVLPGGVESAICVCPAKIRGSLTPRERHTYNIIQNAIIVREDRVQIAKLLSVQKNEESSQKAVAWRGKYAQKLPVMWTEDASVALKDFANEEQQRLPPVNTQTHAENCAVVESRKREADERRKYIKRSKEEDMREKSINAQKMI